MTDNPTVHDVRLFPKTDLDGTTVTNEDLGLPGPLRTLAWAMVIDDGARVGVHMLIDSHDLDACGRLALRIAPAHLGHPLTSGIFAVTTSSIENAKVGTYPEPAEVTDTIAELAGPNNVRVVEPSGHPSAASRPVVDLGAHAGRRSSSPR